MNPFWIAIIFVFLLSVSFLGLCMVRLHRHSRRYRLKEDSYTMLFRFVRMEHIVLSYILFVAAQIIGSFLFIAYLASL